MWCLLDLQVIPVAWLYVSRVRDTRSCAVCGVAWIAGEYLMLRSAVRCAVCLWHASCASRSIPTPTLVLVLVPSV